jgi:hypothetical protein
MTKHLAKLVHQLLAALLRVYALAAFHPLRNECLSFVEHHPLTESQFGLSFGLKVHAFVVQLVEQVSVLFFCPLYS